MPELSETERNEALIHDLYQHFMKGEWEALTEMLDPGFEAVEANGLPYGGRYKGPDGFMQIVEALGAHYENLRISDFEVLGKGGTVIGLFRVQAISRKTGRPIDLRFSEHWKIRDGKITFLEPFYFDTHAIRVAIGLEDS